MNDHVRGLRWRTALVLGPIIVSIPVNLPAQVCANFPSAPGEFFAGLSALPFDTFGGELGADLHGPLALGLSYLREDVDVQGGGAIHSLESAAAYTIRLGNADLCPVAGAELRIVSQGGFETRETWRVPLGLGVGARARLSDHASLAPYVLTQAVFVNTDGPDDRVDARLDFGALLRVARFYATGSFRVTWNFEGLRGTAVEFDRALLLTAGLVF